MNEKVFLNSNYVANRDYNVSVMTSLSSFIHIADIMQRKTTEIDVRTAYPRILYALNGINLPTDFYGEHKKNKLLINKYVNKFWYNDKSNTPKRIQLKNATNRLENVNINKSIIQFLTDKFFESKYTGDLFNFMTFHERKIISKLKMQLADFDEFGSFRRHDSRIYIDLQNNIDTNINFILQDFEYLGVKGWFKNEVKKDKIIQRNAPF